MGWMHRKNHGSSGLLNPQSLNSHIKDTKLDIEASAQFLEHLPIHQLYRPVALSTTDQELPFIEPSVVASAGSSGCTWLVVDNIVYDCTNFASEHPGGSQVIHNLQGHDCSWQFWRFHSEKDMQEFGRPLRIGVTKDAKNKYKEPVRFVGLRKLWASDW